MRRPFERRSKLRCAQFGGIDIVVNNAGLSLSKSLLDTTEQDWDLQHDVMAKGSFLVSKHAASAMIDQGRGGDIVYIVTRTPWWPVPTISPTDRPRRARPIRSVSWRQNWAATGSGSTA